MALFKIHRGTGDWPGAATEGYCYFNSDTGRFAIDIATVASGATLGTHRELINPDAIVGITRSGTTFTLTKADGTTSTVTQQDTNNKVTQTVTSTNALYPFLLAPSGQTTTKTTTSNFAATMGVNASTGALSGVTLGWGSITGKPTYYDAKAIKSITRSGTTFTYTCLDGTTGTFDQQDTNSDVNVTQTSRTTNGEFPILVRGSSAGTSTVTTTTSFANKTTVNPSTGFITEAGIQLQRKYGTLIPFGTNIPANADLNTQTYIKVGNYYCSANATVATFTNCPTTNAFMMQVLSPLSTTIDNEATGTWVYRLRILQSYTGPRYTQYIYSNGTAGNFTYGQWQLTVEGEVDGSTGSATQPVYLSNGKITAGNTYAGGTAVTLNGSSKAKSTAAFYAPTAAGTAGQILKSTAGVPEWASITNSAPTLSWGSTSTIGTVAGTSLTVKMPANPNTNYYHTRVYSTGLKISTGTGVSDMYVPEATASQKGVVIMHPAANCTSFTSDDSTCTVAAVKKAVTLFTNDYAPTKTGGGASGDWAINITGSAATLSATLAVGKGGTGKTSHTSNAILTGNDTSAVKNVTTANGAFYATSANGAAKFGTLPIAQGGTGATTAAGVRSNLAVVGYTLVPELTGGSDFASTEYLPTAGGTMTGALRLNSTLTGTSGTFTGTLTAATVEGAVWNDYAEYRELEGLTEPGRCVVEIGNDKLAYSTGRLAPCAYIVSDTFGFSIGKTETAKTPIAVAGRVLAYTYEDRNNFNIGDAVCSGPNGTISKMTRSEIMQYPERIIGIVSNIPDYEVWNDKVTVNNRIWIKIK